MIDIFRWVFAITIACTLAVWFGDRVGFEGDDLAIIAGAAHFDLRSLDSVYRYAWQPLFYSAARLLVRSGVSPLSLIWLSHILCALGLVLLAETLRNILRTAGRTWIAYGLVLAVPELFITALYFSTTAVALPFFCGALYFLYAEGYLEKRWLWSVAIAATLFAFACLIRFDFAAASLALLLITYHRAHQRKWQSVSLFVAVSAAWGLVILALLGLNPVEILKVAGKLEEAPWALWRYGLVFALAMLPLLAMLPFLLRDLAPKSGARKTLAEWILIAIAAGAVLYPLKALYSGKYLIPAFCLLLIVLASLLQRSESSMRGGDDVRLPLIKRRNIQVCILILAVIYSFGANVDRDARRASIALTASNFATADGLRPLGGYLGFLKVTRDAEIRPPYISLNRHLAQWMMRAKGDSTAILVEPSRGPDSAWNSRLVNDWQWGWPALYIQAQGWTIESYVLRERISMRAPDGRRAEILRGENATDRTLPGRCTLVIGPLQMDDYDGLVRQADLVKKASCDN